VYSALALSVRCALRAKSPHPSAPEGVPVR
jgi:hypothetical protein